MGSFCRISSATGAMPTMCTRWPRSLNSRAIWWDHVVTPPSSSTLLETRKMSRPPSMAVCWLTCRSW